MLQKEAVNLLANELHSYTSVQTMVNQYVFEVVHFVSPLYTESKEHFQPYLIILLVSLRLVNNIYI